MDYRTLGSGLKVSAIGIGCMPMIRGGNIIYGGDADLGEATATIHQAIELGCTFFDTAEIYGPHSNEELLGAAIRGKGDGLVIATKFGFRFNGTEIVGVDSSPENVRRACEGSLKRLGIDCIDLYYQHRVDPATPIEETVGTLAELVREGKIRHIGLSEAGPNTLRKAAAVHPIAALQSEYSLWERDVENDILPVCRELGIGFVPYSPLGRGFLTGQIKSRADLPEGAPLESALQRMRTARQQEALTIDAQGRKRAQIIRAEADARAAKTYADAFGKDPDFYDFYRAMQSYKQTFIPADGSGAQSSIILSPDNDYLREFRGRAR